MMETWKPVGIVPVDGADETIEALVRIYVGRIAGVEETDVKLGEYERAVLLVAQAEVALVQASGRIPHLWFSGPPLSVDVDGTEPPYRPPPLDHGLDE